MNPNQAVLEINQFLATFPLQTRQRGRNYFDQGAVRSVICTEGNQKFVGNVLGTLLYEVTLERDPDEGWISECTCPVGYDCKHACALALQLISDAHKWFDSSLPSASSSARKKGGKKALPSAPALQPPVSPLSSALIAALGRPLKAEETDYVQRVQWFHREVASGRAPTLEILRQLSPRFTEYGWGPLELFPALPRNDLEFWLYCAWEMRRRGLSIREFMLPLTDFSSIEPAMIAWERSKSIVQWRQNLSRATTSPEPAAELIDVRLVILPGEARVQWKTAGEAEFKDLKQNQLKRLRDGYERNQINIVPEALSLWAAVYNPYDYYTACNYGYQRPETIKMLGRVLRVPMLAERVVTAAGLPLARPAEPLHYAMRTAETDADDYTIELLLPDGSPITEILAALPGHPPLYLTELALFEGPPAHGFEMHKPVVIPAPALECSEGVNFLHRLNLGLPPRLAEKTEHVKVPVTLKCEVKSIYPGSETEALFLHASAVTEQDTVEVCGASGWTVSNPRPWRKTYGSSAAEKIRVIDRTVQQEFPRKLEALGAKWDSHAGGWRLKLSRTFPELFLPWLESLPAGVEVLLDRQLATLRNAPVSGSVRLEVEEAEVDWFDLRVALKVSDTELTQDELKLLLNARGGYVRLGKKGWRRLRFDFSTEDDEKLARLGLDARQFTAEPQRMHALQLADSAARKFLPEQQAEKIQRRVGELKTRVTPNVPAGIRAELRPYQQEGFHFLAYLTANRFGGVLADDMGLGKTLQTLAWVQWLREQIAEAAPAKPKGSAGRRKVKAATSNTTLPSLVVCPKSVMDNWRSEAERFCPQLKVLLWQGQDARALERARSENDIVVLNYSQLRSLSPEISELRWLAVILDEAQYIKNPESQTAQTARTLQAEHRLALTGTPIENRLLDLWSIFSFAMPGVLGNRASFTRSYNQKDDPFARKRLAARVRPFLLRRTKNQVAKDLPDRIEEDLVCEMDGEQRTLYRAEFKRAQQMLLKVTTPQELNEQRFNFLTSLLRLRQICCHPALVNGELRKAESAKVSALLDVLEPLMEEGHKVLVFSQFVSMLDILRETVEQRGWKHFFLAGDTENRGDLVREFQASEGASIFLISLKAGGFGLNLTAASYVVLFDPWWNPAVENQAIDRTHRIGQTSKVIAYRLLIKDSIEQKIRVLQRTKATLAEDVLGEEKFSQSLTLDDLKFLFAGE